MRQDVALDRTELYELRNELIAIRCAEEEVDLGQRFQQFGLVPLDHTADGDERTAVPFLLQPPRIDDRVDRLLLRGVDESARVDDDDVRFAKVVGRGPAMREQLGDVPLRVDRVLVAAESDESEAHSGERKLQRQTAEYMEHAET